MSSQSTGLWCSPVATRWKKQNVKCYLIGWYEHDNILSHRTPLHANKHGWYEHDNIISHRTPLHATKHGWYEHARSGVRYMLSCVFVLFFFVLCDLCCQFLWSVHFCIVPSVFSNIFAIVLYTTKDIVVPLHANKHGWYEHDNILSHRTPLHATKHGWYEHDNIISHRTPLHANKHGWYVWLRVVVSGDLIYYHVPTSRVWLRVVVSDTCCLVFLFCFSSSCVTCVASFSGASIFVSSQWVNNKGTCSK
jgi:hypothetical protein